MDRSGEGGIGFVEVVGVAAIAVGGGGDDVVVVGGVVVGVDVAVAVVGGAVDVDVVEEVGSDQALGDFSRGGADNQQGARGGTGSAQRRVHQ